ncbi:MAG: hypothetical protein R6U39_10330 [Candidatus Aegiribacteria sp.]
MLPAGSGSFLTKAALYGFAIMLGGLLFPFRTSLTVLQFQLILLPLTFLYLYSIRSFFLPVPKKRSRAGTGRSAPDPGIVLLITIVALVLAGIGILMLETRMFGQFGYELNIPGIAFVLVACLASALFLFLYKKGEFLPWAVVISLALLYLYSINYFPLHPERSDMLLLIEAASGRFLDGANPYIEYTIFNPVMLTYLPGMWLSYLPAVVSGMDIRYMNLILLVASAVIFFSNPGKQKEIRQSVFAAIFFLNPWLIFRHEIYLPVFIFQMFLLYQLYLSKRIIPSMVVFAWTLASYQFSWILYPLYLALLRSRYGMRAASKAAIVGAAGFLLLVIPFLVASPEGFYKGVFGTWSTIYQIETINLSYWIILLTSTKYIKIVQIALLIIFYMVTMKKMKKAESYFKYATWISVLFILTGQLIWHYFFIMPGIHMLFFARENLSGSAEAITAS